MDCDVLIIGAGVVGLAIANKLSERLSCILVERHPSFGNETSSRNSEVIHSGIYYPKDSLKTKLCVEGNPLIYEHCRKYSVPFNKCGKFIVAINNEDSENLERIYLNGISNGVQGLRHSSGAELNQAEPFIQAKQALFAEETGIVDSHALMQSYESTALQNGCTIAYNHKVLSIQKTFEGYKTEITCGNAESFSICSAIIVNSAGLDSDSIAEMLDLETEKSDLKLNYCKGHYFKIINSKYSFKHLIYPVPEKIRTGLGIHVTIDLNGSAKLGPDTEYLNERLHDYSVPERLQSKFIEAAERYIKGITIEDIAPDYSGIRPKLQKPTQNFADFYIKEESERNLSGFINLIGIESPGLTSSIAIANLVDSMI